MVESTWTQQGWRLLRRQRRLTPHPSSARSRPLALLPAVQDERDRAARRGGAAHNPNSKREVADFNKMYHQLRWDIQFVGSQVGLLPRAITLAGLPPRSHPLASPSSCPTVCPFCSNVPCHPICVRVSGGRSLATRAPPRPPTRHTTCRATTAPSAATSSAPTSPLLRSRRITTCCSRARCSRATQSQRCSDTGRGTTAGEGAAVAWV